MSTDTRIESLETQVRTLKRMLFGVFGLLLVGGLLAATSMQSVPDVVRAKKFEVMNAEGKVGGEMSTDPEGVLSFRSGGLGSIFKVYNRDKKLYASIVTHNDGCAFVLNNKNGKADICREWTILKIISTASSLNNKLKSDLLLKVGKLNL